MRGTASVARGHECEGLPLSPRREPPGGEIEADRNKVERIAPKHDFGNVTREQIVHHGGDGLRHSQHCGRTRGVFRPAVDPLEWLGILLLCHGCFSTEDSFRDRQTAEFARRLSFVNLNSRACAAAALTR
jgi:hypothetical protein